MSAYTFALGLSLLTLVLIAELLRRGRLREKFAALWIVVGLVVLVSSIFPRVLFTLSDALGIAAPINLVFFVSALVLLVVAVQLSAEIGTLEEETRTLAEEVALLRLTAERLEARLTDAPAKRTGNDLDAGT